MTDRVHRDCGYAYSTPKGTIIIYSAGRKICRSSGMDDQTFYDLMKNVWTRHDALVRNVLVIHTYIEIGTGKVTCPDWEIIDGLELHP